jgi:hypothetical protein
MYAVEELTRFMATIAESCALHGDLQTAWKHLPEIFAKLKSSLRAFAEARRL